MRPPAPPGPILGALTLLTMLALSVRVLGLSALLPHHPEPDAHVVEQVERLRMQHVTGESRDAIQGKYPLLLADLVAATSPPVPDPPRAAPLAAHLAAASAPYVAVRRVVAVLGALLVPLVFLLARQWGSRATALLAACFAATSLLSAALSVQARPHAPVATVGLAAVCLACWVARRPSVVGIPLGCVLAAAACGVLQSGAATLPALLLALTVAWRRSPRRGAFGVSAVVGAILAALVLARAYEPALLRSDTVAAQSVPDAVAPAPKPQSMPVLQGHRVDPAAFDGSGAAIGLRALVGHDPGLVLAALVGAWHLRRRRQALLRDPRVWIITLYGLAALGPWALYGRSEARVFLPAVPLLALLAGSGARISWVARLGLLVACINVVRFASLRMADDSLEVAASELQGLDEGELVLVLAHESLPLFEAAASLDAEDAWSRTAWERYQYRRGGLREAPRPGVFYPTLEIRQLAYSDAPAAAQRLSEWLRTTGAAQIVTTTETRLVEPSTLRARDAWAQALALLDASAVGTGLIGRRDGTYLAERLGSWPAAEIWLHARLGPRLEILRLPRD